MDFAYKAMLTATVVALVMLVARNFGERVGGFVGSLPFTQFPALVWIGMSRGDDVAAHAALGSVFGCALSLGAAALLLALVPPRVAPVVRRRNASGAGLVATASCAGLLSSALATVGAGLYAGVAGIISTLPLIGAVAVMVEYRLNGAAGAAKFLRGYVVGTLGKAVFGATVALGTLELGLGPALALAVVLGALTCIAVHALPALCASARIDARRMSGLSDSAR
ncbi:hypothetical protein BH10PSE17_BH10PSE17_12500 [soil metagenome]